VLEPLVAKHHGRIVKVMGDGVRSARTGVGRDCTLVLSAVQR